MAGPMSPMRSPLANDVEGLRREWYWFLVLGIGLLVIGILAIGASCIATLATVMVFGYLMIAAGAAQVILSFWSPKWSGLFMNLLFGVLYVIVGFMLVDDPLSGAVGLTLLLAVFLIVSGSFRISGALLMRHYGWGWCLLNGVISLMMGLIIWRNLSQMSLLVIGIFLGVELIFAGWTWIMFGLAAKNLPTHPSTVA
jgi:uncharacterized membrane protein HdeD (DUF308 family)